MIADIIQIERNFFKKDTQTRLKCCDIDKEYIPRKGDYICINNVRYYVICCVYYPFGDENGTKGVAIYVE